MMKWLLVVIVANAPVKTDLTFNTLGDCLRVEGEMRQAWADMYNEGVKRQMPKDVLDMVRRQMNSGTCIPAK